MLSLKNKRIIVTGGSGFLGKYVVKKLRDRNCADIFVPRKKNFDLRNLEAVKKMYIAIGYLKYFYLLKSNHHKT